MIFMFDEEAGQAHLQIKSEAFKYLIKVRRHGEGDRIGFRHPRRTQILHTYKIVQIEGRVAHLELITSETSVVAAEKPLHIGWCMIDPKSVEKVLAQLNEIGVAKITFIGCERSQKQFRYDHERFERILAVSSQQCGRSVPMVFEDVSSLEAFIAAYPETVVFDFCDTPFTADENVTTVLIGCEGGFSEAERNLLSPLRRRALHTPMVLRSESAAVAIASKILL